VSVCFGDEADAFGELGVIEGSKGGVEMAEALDSLKPDAQVEAPRLDDIVDVQGVKTSSLERRQHLVGRWKGSGRPLDARECDEQAADRYVGEEAPDEDATTVTNDSTEFPGGLGGVFVIEAFVPDLTRFRNNGNVSAVAVDLDTVRLDATRHDPVAQRVDSTHIHIDPSGVQLYPVCLRYAWPAELDLMARLAGLRLHQRWDGWQRQPYTTTSPMAVSVYGR
jgi:hypothetical protein